MVCHTGYSCRFSGVSVPQATSTLVTSNNQSHLKFQWCISSTGHFNCITPTMPPMKWFQWCISSTGHFNLFSKPQAIKLIVSVVYQFHRPLQLYGTIRYDGFESITKFQWCISSTGHFNKYGIATLGQNCFSGVSVPQATSTKR